MEDIIADSRIHVEGISGWTGFSGYLPRIDKTLSGPIPDVSTRILLDGPLFIHINLHNLNVISIGLYIQVNSTNVLYRIYLLLFIGNSY
jgi:hypothetical protein